MRLFGAFNLRDALPVGRTAFIAWLLVIDGSGRTHNFTSSLGSGWRVGSGAVLRNNVYLGEKVDLRVLRTDAVRGWQLPGFNDSSWDEPVLANTSAIGRLEVSLLPISSQCL
jgi:alpha-L-rhamnosidase